MTCFGGECEALMLAHVTVSLTVLKFWGAFIQQRTTKMTYNDNSDNTVVIFILKGESSSICDGTQFKESF